MADARAGRVDQRQVPSETELNNFNSALSVGGSGYLALIAGLAGPSVGETWGNPGQLGWKNFGTEVWAGVGVGHSVAGGASWDFTLPSWLHLPSW